jgi:oxalate decarboxylase/phosphoglucose isomerase-like protein (cupin superfamily)
MRLPFLKYRHWLEYNLIFLTEHFLGSDFFNPPGSIKQKLTDAIYNALNGRELPPPSQIHDMTDPRVVKTSKHYVLYKGIAKKWPAYQKWNLSYFKEVYGDRNVQIDASKGIVDPTAPQVMETIKLKDYIEEMEQGSRKYLKLSYLAQTEKSLQQDLDLNWLKNFRTKFSVGETFYMFIGGKSTITPMHNEFSTTIYIQLYGRKKWIIYPPEERIFLNAISERRPYFFSHFIPGAVNKEYKLGKFARSYEVNMEPGDVLVVPPFFWHYVENQTDSIGVAYKFADVSAAWKSSKLFTLLIFLSTRPSIFYSFFVGRILKKDVILSE